MTHVLLVEPDPEDRKQLRQLLEDGGFGVKEVTSEDLAKPFDISDVQCIVSSSAPHPDGYAALLDIVGSVPVILVTHDTNVAGAVAAIKRGASDYLTYPLAVDELKAAIQRILSSARGGSNRADFPMIGQCPAMCALFERIAKIAPTNASVLIQGESGTGKELVAHALHAASTRQRAPMISLNCAAIPASLIEAELFGRDDAENTTLDAPRNGLLEAANGGTLFLDEIGELPMDAQARLLQVLRESEIRRVGTAEPIRVDVRLLTATHRDLKKLITSEQFREDLYYRLNVVTLDIPPLRERDDDVLLLAEAILARITRKLAKISMSFSADARRAMLDYPWPGNVWELENAVERAVILSDGKNIEASLLAIEIPQPHVPEVQAAATDQTSLEDYFVSFVTTHQEQLTETELAEKLGISRKSLWERRQRLKIPRKKTKKRGPRRDST
ncbi:MAG: sigma-54 dependent transcriptional regulator [Gammaproteobacteria bacterium]|nr:sigma-54 dependent transcriptional regulator [Gammaproteobacteria bacterium]